MGLYPSPGIPRTRCLDYRLHRWDRGYAKANLLRVEMQQQQEVKALWTTEENKKEACNDEKTKQSSFPSSQPRKNNNLRVLLLSGKVLSSNAITGNKKAALVKRCLDMQPDVPLSARLCQTRTVLIVREIKEESDGIDLEQRHATDVGAGDCGEKRVDKSRHFDLAFLRGAE